MLCQEHAPEAIPAGFGVPSSPVRLVEQCGHRLGQRRRIPRRNQIGDGVVPHHFAYGWDVARHDRKAEGEGFDECPSQAFEERREHEQVGGGHEIGDVCAVSQKRDRVGHSEVGDRPLELGCGSSPSTHDQQPRAGVPG